MVLHRVAIVGASLAGLRAAQTLRGEGFAGEITMIGAEPHLPYNRPPLSKSVLDGDDDVALPGAEDVAARWLRGRRAVRLAPDTNTVGLDDGTEVGYDGLVIATGVRPRHFSDAQPTPQGVHVLRTIEDAHALRDALAAGPRRVAVVGGGFIGGEIASAARVMGLAVTLIDAAPLPMVRGLGQQAAEWLARHHQENGVELISGVRVAGVDGDQRVTGVRLADGRRIPADLVVVGAGVLPNTEWLAGSGIPVDDGIVTTAELFVPGLSTVVAAGDVVRWPHPLFDGELIRIEHWANASDQAALAARNLLRGPADAVPFTDVPSFGTRVHGARVQSAGLPQIADDSHIVTGSTDGDSIAVAFTRSGVLVGAATINAAKHLIKLRRAIAARERAEAVVA